MSRNDGSSSPPPPTSPTSPLAQYPPLPPLQNKSLAPEFYGFATLISTYLLFVVYLLWALLPDEWIVWLGVEWYPSREWSLLIPAYTIVVILLTYFTYFALAIRATPAFNDLSTMIGELTLVSSNLDATKPHQYLSHLQKDGAMREMHDVPIGLVNRILYCNSKTTSHLTAERKST
ncbi:hypothetical protein JAAARDRAFT_128781 [Jaapia argillacea MUCL 33604]|uniref:PIG-P domain-containing protein n=1 Tax=Jaapia argillacea MUCL 33604 TaxID=933084 RepID=A0A067Q598_9AGAM|nr:hypothetical protein JAAARDRAFT_128781 [Jaapia argillacea MUCL 33604]